ncbi:prephenate dehydrogenase dimerization domain-containing protein [Bacillus swezeyi]|uniref:Prephenate dehydrogenase/arogenate dehydrogenase family protein n=1 Tax=Bacillus swezeyi TaxID=1925020 RepID=A0A5M8RUT9_9BACI|nr:prephenate dehydrogenase dimerization domain-containing protein [Bacillus swezeyi]KAA6449612.1 prephenate dehydrogenase/arogenate dehydrogenase family protein [Bacillus swezeyi]TYS33626.1 prephenate dehydrogenase/arogenate dehydrogenase family protein [Bacillus swezeyi]
MSKDIRQCVIVGGAGGVGGMFADLLEGSGVEICIIDMNPPSVSRQFKKCDITVPTPQAKDMIQKADMVMLALPENAALQAVKVVGPLMKPDSLFVHTLSVQSPIFKKIHSLGLPFESIGLNPMFAPSLSIVGRPAAVIVQNDGPKGSHLIQMISDWKGRPVLLEAEEHDQLVAAMQALTHSAILTFGLALSELDVDIAKLSSLAPPPHATMLALLARISSGTPDVYWDVQSVNHQAVTARAALAEAVGSLDESVRDKSVFIELLRKSREVFGNEIALYQDLCTSIFEGPLSQLNQALKAGKYSQTNQPGSLGRIKDFENS